MEFSTLNSSSMVEIPRHSLRSFKVSKRWLCDDMSDFGLQRLIFAWTVLSVKKKTSKTSLTTAAHFRQIRVWKVSPGAISPSYGLCQEYLERQWTVLPVISREGPASCCISVCSQEGGKKTPKLSCIAPFPQHLNVSNQSFRSIHVTVPKVTGRNEKSIHSYKHPTSSEVCLHFLKSGPSLCESTVHNAVDTV